MSILVGEPSHRFRGSGLDYVPFKGAWGGNYWYTLFRQNRKQDLDILWKTIFCDRRTINGRCLVGIRPLSLMEADDPIVLEDILGKILVQEVNLQGWAKVVKTRPWFPKRKRIQGV